MTFIPADQRADERQGRLDSPSDFATAFLRREALKTTAKDAQPDDRAEAGARDEVQHRIEACLDALDILEEDLRENLSRLWGAEDEAADARSGLDHAEQTMIVRGVAGKNEAERRAHLAITLTAEREAVENADRQLRSARREQEEYRTTLDLIQKRLKGLELLVTLRRRAGAGLPVLD